MNLTDNSSSGSIRRCSDVSLTNVLLVVFLCNYISLVPLFAYVPFVACQARKRSKPTPHSDLLTFNCIVFEFINIMSLSVYYAGSVVGNDIAILFGIGVFSIICTGQTTLHVLTCVERHVAVVHPVVFMKLKQTRTAEKIGHASIVFVWMICIAAVGFVYVNQHEASNAVSYVILAVCVAVVSHCSASVLRALLGHAPGENRHERRVDPSKKKAFKAIMFILAALLLRLVGIPVRGQLLNIRTTESCLWASAAIWMNLPSSLVLPLLYLRRMGKLPGAKKKTQDKR